MYDSKISTQKQKSIYNIKYFMLTSVMAFFQLYRNSLLKILKFCEKLFSITFINKEIKDIMKNGRKIFLEEYFLSSFVYLKVNAHNLHL